MKRNNLLFSESYAAAQSLKNSWTRMASTFGCISVALSPETLTIRPHWFAGWLIRLLGLDLFHEIPVGQIKSIAKTGKWFSYGKVEIQFVAGDGNGRRVLVYMKKYREFIETVGSLMSS